MQVQKVMESGVERWNVTSRLSGQCVKVMES